jgi:hypothetical protein
MTGRRSGDPRLGVLRIGDRVVFEAAEHTVVAISGNAVRLHGSGTDLVILLPHLVASSGFRFLDGGALPRLPPVGLLEGLPPDVVEAARAWERHVVEVETGLPPHAPPAATPRPEYDPARRSLAEREQAKVAELAAAGQPVGVRTLQRMRQRYRDGGLWGLVDRRALRPASPTGTADPRLVVAITAAVAAETDASTGTRGRPRHRVEQALAKSTGQGRSRCRHRRRSTG